MKKILFFLIVGLFSCKSDYITLDNNDSVEIDDSNVETPFSRDASEAQLYERASMKITSASAGNVVGVNAECEKYKGYAKLKTGSGSDGTEFTLRGTLFGATQGAKVAEVEIPSGTTPVACSVVSWSDTEVKVKIPKVAENTKNITIKIRLKEDARTTTASFKSVGWFETENIWFGHNRWDIMQNSDIKARFANYQNNKVSINENWIPAIGDVVLANSTGQMGIVTNTAFKSGGKMEVKVTARNTTCKGTVTTKTFIFYSGTFSPKTTAIGFDAFDKYF